MPLRGCGGGGSARVIRGGGGAEEEKEKGAGWLSASGGMALLREDAQEKVRAAARVRLGRAMRAQPSWPCGLRGSSLLRLPPAGVGQ